ncbi:MAG: leucine-rich repeat protein [Ruminococcus sp.]|nr:leucine-rich repeat protein [Ruminococcus sp.]
MIKKVFAVILVLTVVVPLTVWGMSGAKVSAATGYKLEGNVLTITGTGDMDDYWSLSDIPWYNDKDKIRAVVISSGVTSIGDRAFKGFTVMDVTIPNTVTRIGDSAFENCTSLYSITMPDSVTQIGKNAFNGCSAMMSITLSKNLEAIPERAFYKCSKLNEITIPGSVKSLGYEAFLYCSNLKVNFNEGLETIEDRVFGGLYSSYQGITNSEVVIPDSVTSIGEKAFTSNTNITKLTTGKNLKTIGNSAFSGNVITTIDLSRSTKLETIGEEAFGWSGFTSIVIPDSVTTIGKSAFRNCDNLTSITLPKNLTSISPWTFFADELTSIEIPSKVEKIGETAFYSTNLTKVVIPPSVIEIGKNAFQYCHDLKALDISSNPYLALNSNAFGDTSLNHIHIPASRDSSIYRGQYGLPADESCYFQIGSDGKCPAAYCPFRDSTGTVGDINGDGKLNNTDIILLGRAYMAGDGDKYLSVADMNGDGRITNADIILLGRLYMTGK